MKHGLHRNNTDAVCRENIAVPIYVCPENELSRHGASDVCIGT